MRAKVIKYLPDQLCHICRTEDDNDVRIDIEVDGGIPEGGPQGEALVGRVVEWSRASAYISIAHHVRLVEEVVP